VLVYELARQNKTVKLHPRHELVTRAGLDLSVALVEIIRKYSLTYGELAYILARQTLQWAQNAIKDERAEPEPSAQNPVPSS
jgi:hypothetical protein